MPDFAALEARVNRTVATHLANASMVFTTGAVAVVFERPESLGMPSAMGAPRNLHEWQAGAPMADFAAHAIDRDTTGTINGATYRVTDIDTDATGWQTLTLRKVS